MTDTILQVIDLRKLYPIPRGFAGTLLNRPRRWVHAVDQLSFEMARGEILTLVGESGSGKTTTGMCVLGLEKPTSGQVMLEGKNVINLTQTGDRKKLRRQVQLIFQDPYESLNPRQNVFEIIAEPLRIHKLASDHDDLTEMINSILHDVGLRPASTFINRYPQELSGGQRQRLVIAGALALKPKLLVADEPVSMLDVSIRADILNLLLQLRQEHGITILYITHDLSTAAYVSDRVAVMYLGQIVEIGSTASVLRTPMHPYTRALLSVIPVPNPRRRKKRLVLQGESPNPVNLPSGCRFHPRCPIAQDECRRVAPSLKEEKHGHQVRCPYTSGQDPG
jgi:oligopeptide/dipeptide ABC transporter ATP-binding protein